MSESDETTRVIRRKTVTPETGTDAEKTVRPSSRAAKPPPLPVSTDAAKATNPIDDEKTHVYRSPSAAGKPEAPDASSPTVGWLLIMAGPGRGASMTLGYGMNHVGRSAANRIIIDFGDEEISRKTHTTLTYDPRGKKFYIQPGPDATNLTYLGEEPNLQPILTPTEIFGGETIMIGHTKLKFIAFCGPQFSWD
jgi:hypothetical protein